MPRNRQDVPREERISRLLDIAQEHFVSRGYAGTAVAEIARAAGIEPGSVYWYFRSKDAAFAAVLNRILDAAEARCADSPGTPVDKLLAAVDAVENGSSLQTCLHERAGEAEPVLACHQRLHGWLLRLAGEAVADLVPPASREVAAEAVVATISGTLTSPVPGRTAVELTRFLLSSFRAAAPERMEP